MEPDDSQHSQAGALHDAELRTRAILDTVVDGIITIDRTGIVGSFNRAAEGIFGYTAAEVIGRNISMLMPPPYQDEHDGYLESYVTTRKAKVIGIGRTVKGLRKDGTVFPMDLAVSGTRLADGEVFTGIVRDITEKVRTEQLRRDAEERMRAVVETAVDGIIVISESGLIEEMNPAAAKLFGWDVREVMGKNISMLMPPPYRDEHDGYLAKYLESGVARIIGLRREVVGLRKDGSTFPMDLSVSDLKLQHRRLFTGIVRDVTERNRAESALREAQKLDSLGVLAGGIAHDFNNLLVGIIGNAGLALDMLTPDSPARSTVREIEVVGKRAAELAHQMLAYSGKGRFTIEPISMNGLVEEMTQLLGVSIRKGVAIRYNLTPGLPAVEADPTQIRQMIMNLVLNASDAIGDRSGVVTISTGMMYANREYLCEAYLPLDLPEGDYVFMEVSDTGEGMSLELQQRIFEPFFSTKFTGRGLGLAVVLGVVRGHRGAIKVYSEEGHGTTIRVLFPADRAAEIIAPTEVVSSTKAVGLAMVVDDDETVRTITTTAIRRMGFVVLTAADGQEAVEVFRQHREDVRLVVMDLTMPRMSGEEAFREIQMIRSDTPVIIMSGFSQQETSERFSGKNVAAFIQKPYQISALRDTIQAVLDRAPTY